MKKVFRFLYCSLPLALMAVGCVQNDPTSEFEPGTNKNGEVTIEAAIENASTRASLVNTGEARWLRNDAIGAVCNDGSTVVLTLDGTGDTRRALFKGTVPEGKSLGEYAIYPSTATFANNSLSMVLPSEVAPASTGSCSLMAATMTENNKVEFKQMLGYIALQISNVNNTTAKIVISSDKNMSGNITAQLPEAMTTGVAATKGDAGVAIVLGDKPAAIVNATIALPVGDYEYLTATAYDKSNRVVGEVALSSSRVSLSRALMLSFSGEMPEYSVLEPIEGTVLVADIYWAQGNLEYDKNGQADAGFAAGWRIAPHQAHYFNAELGKTRTYENYDTRDVFNLGGIADPFDCQPESAMNAAVGTNISGKLYTDQACTTPTTDFAAAKFGDIAFWASGGTYRMPSYEDIAQLLEKASANVAEYQLNGNVIKGIYFFDPAPGTDPVQSTDITITLTDEDLKVGLFLPYNGRGYNKSSIKDDRDNRHDVFNTGTNCIYLVSTVKSVDPSTKNYVEGGCYGYTFDATKVGDASTKGGLEYLNGAMNSTARFALRPIYIGK